MTRALLLLALLACGTGVALADPFTAVATLSTFAGAAAGGATFLGLTASTWLWVGVAASALGAIDARRKARKAAARQRDEYNAGLQDRTVSALRSDPPWQVIYGRAIVGGAYVDLITTDKTSKGEIGNTVTRADGLKTLVLVLAAHEVEAIHEVYIDGMPVGAVDGDGWAATGSAFFGQVTDSRIAVFTTELAFTEGPLVAVLSAYTGVGDAQENVTVTIESGNRLVAAVPGVEVTVNFAFTRDAPVVRISKFLGADSQTTNPVLAALVPSRYTSNHRLRGCAGVVVTLDLEDVRFQGGLVNITADVSGRKVYDPRTTTTAWSANPALCIRDFLVSPWGFEVESTDVDDASVIVAANACDELIDLTVGATTEVDQARYTCHGAFTTDQNREGVLEDLVDSMAGMVTYSAKWRLLAGAWSPSVMTLTDDDLHGQIEVVQADTPMSELFNGIRGQLFLAGAQSPSDFNPYANSVFVADDGRELWTTSSFTWTNHLARARNLCRIMVEKNRAGQVLRYPAKLKAWPLQIGDRVTVTSSEYGITSKLYRVTDWAFEPTGAVDLTLQEDAAELYDEADAAVADPTPNTDLADPWAVPALAGLSATSGGTTLQVMGDGTMVPRVLVDWDAITAGNVVSGGAVEVLWRSQTTATWAPPALVAGTETTAWLQGVTEGDVIIIEARAVNAAGRRGSSSFVVHTVVGKTAPPSDVTSLDYAIKPGQVQITWGPCPDVDYAATELRVGSTWAAATLLWRGAASEYHHPRPPNGAYTVLAKHYDTSGNESATAASLSVTVDDSIDGGTSGSLTLTTDRFPYFSFSTGTTHTAQSPGATDIIITAALVNLSGTPTITAEAFSASNASLGAVTLTGGGLTRTLTAAAFVAPGTSGSVRYVVVTGSLAGVTDSLTVFRQDSTTTAPRIYLSNPQHTVATDSNGDGGDYSGATTAVEVYAGLTNATSSWTFAITPDSGVTATINGGAGPVTGTASVTVAVSAMTVPDGAVLVTASKTGETDLTATFDVAKNEATGIYNVYWNPRTEIILPIDLNGTVTSYADAYSSLEIDAPGGVSDVANWEFSRTDTNVTSTLTDNLVEVTAMLSLGSLGTSSYTDISAALPTGWTAIKRILIGDGFYIATGVSSSTSKIQRSTDFETWTTIDIGASLNQPDIAYGNGVVIISAHQSVDNAYRYSTDGGLTWSAGTYPSSFQRYTGSLAWMGDRFVVCANGSTTAYWSTNGTSWTSFTAPATSGTIYGSTSRWLLGTPSATYYYSSNNGSSWTSVTPFGASALGLLGAAYYKGRWTLVPNDGTYAAAGLVAYSDNGTTWNTTKLPTAYLAGTVLPAFLTIRGVLYLGTNLASGTSYRLMYTTDGRTWSQGDSMSGTRYGLHENQSSIDHQIDFVPTTINDSPERYYKYPLNATSNSEGAVTVTATKPGEVDVVRVLPVRKGTPDAANFAFSATPAVLYLPATSDGVVTSFANATITAQAQVNGLNDTANWSWSWTATNLTPSSGSTNVATFTAMSANSGVVTFTATRAGYPSVSGSLNVYKQLGTTSSGPRIGSEYAVLDTASTLIGVRFNTDGSVDVKRGSGSYAALTTWLGAVISGAGSSYWMYMAPEAGTHALSTGTENTWLQLSSARTFEMSDATSGTHTYVADVYIGTSSTGANAVMGRFTLRLIVP